METHKTINISLDEAKKWFNSGNATLKEIALKAFSKDELIYNFKNITTFKKACETLGLNYDTIVFKAKEISFVSKASAAMFKLNIVKKALNLNQDLHLSKNPEDSYIYYPLNNLVTEDSVCYRYESYSNIIGKIKCEGKEYCVVSSYTSYGSNDGLGSFYSDTGVGTASASIGFIGCANKEIAQHLGKYFGMLITEAKYGDLPDFEIVEDKYGNA